ncbi:hypothetical protein [Prevotella aurantiaca]|nr:hypothetical protein [Prevotella aurantiaca]
MQPACSIASAAVQQRCPPLGSKVARALQQSRQNDVAASSKADES